MARTILIALDSEIDRQFIKNVLCDEYDVLEVADGEAALELIHRTYCSLSAVLLNIVMPKLGGYDILAQMRSNRLFADIPVILIADAQDEKAWQRALSLGAADFLLRPYPPDLVRHRLRTCIAERRERELAKQLQAVLDNVNCGITAVCLSGDRVNRLLTNNKYFELLGYTQQQFRDEIGEQTFQTIHPDDRARVLETTRHVAQTMRSATIEFRSLRRDGTILWLSASISMTTFEGVDSPVQLCVYTDITDRQTALEHLRMREEENRLAIAHSSTAVCRYSIAEQTLSISPNVDPSFEMPRVIGDVPYGQVKSKRVSPATAKAYLDFYERIVRGEREGKVVYQRKSTSGWRWIEGHFSTVFSDKGQPTSAVISFSDITDRLEKETAYKKWLQSIENKDPNTYTLLRCIAAKETVIEAKEGALLSFYQEQGHFVFDARVERYAQEHILPEDRKALTAFLNTDAMLARFFQGRHNDFIEYRELLPEGGARWLRLTVDLVDHPHAKEIEAYILFEDIDCRKRMELQMLERAQYDPMTGVYNRATFVEKVNHMIAISKPNVRHALLMLDVDGFKQINDTFGHATGDKTLSDISQALRTVMRRNDLIGRLGGDEFGIFIEDVPSDAMLSSKAGQICALVRRSFGGEVEISGSIGITVTPRDGTEFDALYKNADAALYYVKGSGKDNFAFYQCDMSDRRPLPQLAAKNEKHPKEKKPRMLIVDDSTIDQEMLASLFAEEFHVEKAKDGNTALIRLRHYGAAFSIVLLDLIMPGMDGFAVLKKMRESPELRSIPVIVVSSETSRETALRAIREGAAEFVLKPIDPDVLKIRIQSSISKLENERLRAKNTFLEHKNSEIVRNRTIIDSNKIVVVEHDWFSGAFVYDPKISEYMAGNYDDRPLWRILQSDFVADTQTVERIQELVQRLADNRERKNVTDTLQMKTPSGAIHWFTMTVCKAINEFGIVSKLYLTFVDRGSEKPST